MSEKRTDDRLLISREAYQAVLAQLDSAADQIREMQELLIMASELSWAIGQDDVGDEWPKLVELEERLHKFHKPSWDKKVDIS